MAKPIRYIDEHGNSVDKVRFLMPLSERTGFPLDYLNRLVESYNYTGTVQLPLAEYESLQNSLPQASRKFLDTAISVSGGRAYLRGKEYFWHITLNQDRERVRERLIEMLPIVSEASQAIPLTEELDSLQERLLCSAILDHKKHYSMISLIGIYGHMLSDPDFDVDIYKQFRNQCKQDVDNYYRYVLGMSARESLHNDCTDTDVLKSIGFPKDSLRRVDGKLEHGARKLVMREMDHPGQLIVYTGNLLQKDGNELFNVVVNPLNGAVEIGFAIKSITEAGGINKINDVQFVKYSRYGEDHKEIGTDVGRFVPRQLWKEFEAMRGKRILLLDDNGFSGQTIRELKRLLQNNLSQNVKVSVIERPVDIIEKLKISGKPYLDPVELDIPAISKLRYVDVVEEEINKYNLGGEHGVQ